MEKNLVGYRFSPTGEELINYYLKNKILGKSWLVDEAINEINICGYKPEFLPSLSKLESKDPVWYFFCPKEYTSANKKVTKRTTPSGFWKVTGVDRKIKDRRRTGVEIGIKKTLVYHEGKAATGERTPWVMHEYHITSLPPNQRTYVICQVMYKGEDGYSLYGNNSNQPSHSMVSDLHNVRAINTAPDQVVQVDQEDGMTMNDLLNPLNEQEGLSPCDGFDPNTFFRDYNNNNNYYSEVQPQTPCGDDYWNGLLGFNGGNFEDVLPNPEINVQEDCNNHRPQKPSTGIIVDCSSDSNDSSSDSDAETISATSYQGMSSPGDSDGSSSRPFHTSEDETLLLRKNSCKDIQTPAETSVNRKTKESHFTRRTAPSKQEVKEGKSSSSAVKIEKKGWFITEEAKQRNRKNPPYIYLMNMIIGFILLVAVIANIISVLLSVKT